MPNLVRESFGFGDCQQFDRSAELASARSESPVLGRNMNPFSVPAIIPNERGVFEGGRKIRSGFLYRMIEIDSPRCQMVYDGWWFRQKVTFDRETAWMQISWLTIRRRVEFKVPAAVDPLEPDGVIEIDFGRTLMIRRFRLWIGGEIVYDEIN